MYFVTVHLCFPAFPVVPNHPVPTLPGPDLSAFFASWYFDLPSALMPSSWTSSSGLSPTCLRCLFPGKLEHLQLPTVRTSLPLLGETGRKSSTCPTTFGSHFSVLLLLKVICSTCLPPGMFPYWWRHCTPRHRQHQHRHEQTELRRNSGLNAKETTSHVCSNVAQLNGFSISAKLLRLGPYTNSYNSYLALYMNSFHYLSIWFFFFSFGSWMTRCNQRTHCLENILEPTCRQLITDRLYDKSIQIEGVLDCSDLQ